MNVRTPREAKSTANLKIKQCLGTPRLKSKLKNDIHPLKMADITLNFDSFLQNIKNFEGKKEQDVEYFLEQFEQLADATKLPDNLKVILLKSKLAGNAKQILINSPDLRNESVYDTLKQKLIENFKSEKSFVEAQNKFMSLKQLPSQNVEDFARQFNLAAQQYLSISGHASKNGAKELLTAMKLTKFIEALRPDISFEVQKTGPENFENALKIAKKIEIALNNASSEINAIKTEKKSPLYEALIQLSKDQSTQIKEMTEQINNLKLQETKSETRENKEKIYCHICEKSNHQTQDCYFNQKNKNNVTPRQQSNYARPRFQRQKFYNDRRTQNQRQNQSQNRFPFYQPVHDNVALNFTPQWGFNPNYQSGSNYWPQGGNNHQFNPQADRQSQFAVTFPSNSAGNQESNNSRNLNNATNNLN